MKILIIGNGAREYSIGLALLKSPKTPQLFFSPGNGATAKLGINIKSGDFSELANTAKAEAIGLAIIGPEQPLAAGISNILERRGIAVFGPSKAAAMLEASKAFMKNLANRFGIPTASYIESSDADECKKFIDTLKAPIVVKADGLCAGKGVIIAKSHEEACEAVDNMLSGQSFGQAGRTVVVEEFLDGFELSVFAISDGHSFVMLPPAQDHKRLLSGDKGPNTGGMGAYAPTPLADEKLMAKIEKRIIQPAIEGMRSEGTPFEGALFAGVMVVNNEPYLLEFNVRFGDPECEVLLPLFKSDPLELFLAAAQKNLDNFSFELNDEYAVGVVAASRNYPHSQADPAELFVDEAKLQELGSVGHISYAGVSLEANGKLYATGGRVFTAVGVGSTLKAARDNAYMIAGCVNFDGKQLRDDIAYQALNKETK